jgi:hypothetical protein
LQEISQYWSARAKVETDLASELIGKLTSARSVPESAKAYQEWVNQRMSMTVEDSQHLVADGFKLVQTAARSLSNGAWIKSPGQAKVCPALVVTVVRLTSRCHDTQSLTSIKAWAS